MGLDIYCYRVEKKYAHLTPNEIRENREKDAKNKFAKKCVKWLKMLKDAHKGNAHTYYDTYQTFLVQLKKDEYFKTYDWKIDTYKKAVLSPMEVLVEFEKTKKSYFKVEDAYFRKVNFIYRYFSQFENFMLWQISQLKVVSSSVLLVTMIGIGTMLRIA